MRWRLFLSTWLVVFLLSPSVIFPQAFLMTMSSPDDPGLPLVIPFGAVHWAAEWGFLVERSFVTGEARWAWDFVVTYFISVLPLLIFTFFLSLGLYYFGRYIASKVRDDRGTGSPAAG